MAALLETVWVRGRRRTDRFDCPFCGVERDATRTAVRRWLALLGWRVAPAARTEDYLVCRVCGRAYAATELRAGSGDSTRSEDERAIEALAAAAVFSDSAVRPIEKEAVGQVLRRFTGRRVDRVELDGVIRSATRRRGNALERLALLGLLLDDDGKRRILQAAYFVSASDRHVHPEESRFLMRIGELLDMHPRQLRDAIRQPPPE